MTTHPATRARDVTPWTIHQFQAALRAAGWEHDGQTGCYQHSEHGEFHCYGYGDYGPCENWWWFAQLREVPDGD